ncbi:MAG: hypothetical protein EON59_00565 [Alphaproteobacteria bacterium]|nr:MAG: hypothetical protein EON59_00565 [Alphaproteobacteria bacterium]
MRLWLVVAALALSGCVSTQMRTFVGKDIAEVQLRYGPPAQVVDLADGRRAYQFKEGGGAAVIPGNTTASATTVGNTTFVNSQTTPAMVIDRNPCLLTFIATPTGSRWTVQDIRVPKELVC